MSPHRLTERIIEDIECHPTHSFVKTLEACHSVRWVAVVSGIEKVVSSQERSLPFHATHGTKQKCWSGSGDKRGE